MSAPYSSSAEWNPAAQNYGSSVGRSSSHAAVRLIDMASSLANINASSKVLDVGAGAGAVTLQILNTTAAQVTASDLHQSMLDSIPAPAGSNLVLKPADARHLTREFEKQSFSHVFCTFVLQTVTTPLDVLRQMREVLDPETGVVGIACWAQKVDGFEIWEKACKSIDPTYELPIPFDDPQAWRTEEEVKVGLQKAGFKDVKTEFLEFPFAFEGTQKYLDFWFGAKNPGVERIMSNWKGSMDAVKVQVEKIVREEYDDGRKHVSRAVLGVGRV